MNASENLTQTLLLLQVTTDGLPMPELEHKFDEHRRWRFDYAWPAQRVALEVEGGAWTGGRHTRGAGFLADIEKYNAANLAGWHVYRCTPEQAQNGEIMDTLRQALGAALEAR